MTLQKKEGVLNTVDEMKIYLNEMKLSVMSDTLDKQIKDPNIGLKTADERIIEMISNEYLTRYANKIKRGLSKSGLKYPDADYTCFINDNERQIDKTVLDRLMTCNFIDEKKNLIITGPCGCGKTWIASSIGVKAITQLRSVKFYNTSKLIMILKDKEIEGTYLKALDQIAKLDLLILDDIGMMNLDLQSCRIFFEILESRDQNGSVILVSQYPVSSWYPLFENATYADASLSRATGKAYKLDIKGKDFRRQ